MSGSENFFIGWQKRPPARLERFLLIVSAGFLLLLGGLSLGLGQADDPAGPDFAAVPGLAPLPEFSEMQGVVTRQPYPLLHRGDGRSVLLAGDGKQGAGLPAALEGQTVTLSGYVQQRGSIGMLVVQAAPVAGGPGVAPLPQPLGRFRITGEICDGKCAAGAMRAGTGLAHRACATLCISSAIPAVFVSTAPVHGQAFMLLAGPDGGPMPAAMLPLIGQRVTLEGALERLGSVLVFRAGVP